MKSEKKWIIAVSLSVTSVLFMLLLSSVIFIFAETNTFVTYALPFLIISLVVFSLILNHKFSKNSFAVFISIFLALCSIFVFLMRTDIVAGTVKQWWPMLGVLSAVALVVAGFYKYKKFRFEFLIPALALFFIGNWFLLFSWKIIAIPFIQVVIICGPLLLIMSIVVLFVMFYYQKKNKLFIVKDDEYDQFENDEYFKNHTD